MNSNEYYKGIYNIVVNQTSLNPVLLDELVIEEYGIYSNDYLTYTYPVKFINNESILSLEKVSRSKTNANLLGLLVDISNLNPNSNTYLIIPITDSLEGSTTLLNLLKINNKNGNQCLLKFSVFNLTSNSSPVYLKSKSNTSKYIKFVNARDNVYESYCLLYPINSYGPYTYVLVTNISNNNIPIIEFRTLVYPICKN